MNKKYKYFSVFAITIIAALSIPCTSFCQEYYQKGRYRLIRSEYNDSFVAGIDIPALAGNHLEDFKLVNSTTFFYSVKKYSFKSNINGAVLRICIGIFPSVKETEEVVLDSMNEAAAGGKEGPFNGVDIGDNDWYFGYYTSPDKEYHPSSIVFIRKNVIIMVGPTIASSEDYYPDILSLAQKIDDDIMKGAPYVILTDTLSPPVIHSVSLSKNVLVEGEEATITINASDPLSQIEHYRTLGGAIKYENDPVNVFRTVADRGLFKEPFFGTHTIKIWVINKNNFFSRIYEVKLTFYLPSAVTYKGNTAESPHALTLHRNAPNPFNPSTTIRYSLGKSGHAELAVFNSLGQKIRTLAEGPQAAGVHTVQWNGCNDSGQHVSSGVYFYRLRSGTYVQTMKMVLFE